MQLFNTDGLRLYMIPEERELFYATSQAAPRIVRTFCGVLYYTGARPTEVQELTADRIDLSGGQIIIRSLKKRSPKPVYRAVPVPQSFLDTLDLVHNIKDAQKAQDKGKSIHLWPWDSRTTAWNHVKAVIEKADIAPGPHATPKGLRHGFAVACITKGIQLNMVKKWMGHASIETTAIYANAIGEEERSIASRLWEQQPQP